jgi:hypothetical protein
MVTLRAFSYVLERQLVGRDDDVVYVSPVLECGVAVRLLDPKVRHRSRRPEYAVVVKCPLQRVGMDGYGCPGRALGFGG